MFLHPVCKKIPFMAAPSLLTFCQLGFISLRLHILAMELAQIFSPHPEPVISSAFSPLSFLAAGASQHSSASASPRLVPCASRAASSKQNTAELRLNQTALFEESAFSPMLRSQVTLRCSTAFLLSAEVWAVLPVHIKSSSL